MATLGQREEFSDELIDTVEAKIAEWLETRVVLLGRECTTNFKTVLELVVYLNLCASGVTFTGTATKDGRMLTPSTCMYKHTERSVEVQPERMARPDQK
jgi:hypothetical protein